MGSQNSSQFTTGDATTGDARHSKKINSVRAPAEDVRVVLLEAPDAREALERAAELVAVQHAKVGHADGKLAVAAQPVPKHQAVPCARMQRHIVSHAVFACAQPRCVQLKACPAIRCGNASN